jgi:hypothetical protein
VGSREGREIAPITHPCSTSKAIIKPREIWQLHRLGRLPKSLPNL